MILSDTDINHFLETGEIKISPLIKENIQSASVDLTLGAHFLEVDEHKTPLIDMSKGVKYQEVIQESNLQKQIEYSPLLKD